MHLVLCWGVVGGMLVGKDTGGFWRVVPNHFDGNGGKEQGGGVWITKEWIANEWHHAAFTWTSQSLKVYVDGRLRGEATPTMELPARQEATFELGGEGDGQSLQAALAELEVYDRALSEQEIASRYKSGE